MTGLVSIDRPTDGVAVVTIRRAEKKNALSIAVRDAVADALDELAADGTVRAVVLTGDGPVFSAGFDLTEFQETDPGFQERLWASSDRFHATVLRFPLPLVAAVNGPAFGGGMCLSLGADLRIAAEHAEFNATGIVNGLTSAEMGAGWILPRLIGAANSNDLLLTGRRIDAAEALRIGLVSRVVPTDRLLDEAREMAQSMAQYSHHGLEATKQSLWVEQEISSLHAAIEFEDRNQLMAGFTDNLPEAIRAFDEGRDPVYRDEPRKDLFQQP